MNPNFNTFRRETAHLSIDPNNIPAELVQNVGIYIKRKGEKKNG